MEKRVEAGQKVYIIDNRYRHRGGAGHQLKEAVVTKVGRKYFYVAVSQWSTERFRLEDFRHDYFGYTNRIYLYLSEQEYTDTCQYNHLLGEIRSMFKRYNLEKVVGIDQLKQIAAILGINELEI
jgi:hypothetical protein